MTKAKKFWMAPVDDGVQLTEEFSEHLVVMVNGIVGRYCNLIYFIIMIFCLLEIFVLNRQWLIFYLNPVAVASSPVQMIGSMPRSSSSINFQAKLLSIVSSVLPSVGLL